MSDPAPTLPEEGQEQEDYYEAEEEEDDETDDAVAVNEVDIAPGVVKIRVDTEDSTEYSFRNEDPSIAYVIQMNFFDVANVAFEPYVAEDEEEDADLDAGQGHLYGKVEQVLDDVGVQEDDDDIAYRVVVGPNSTCPMVVLKTADPDSDVPWKFDYELSVKPWSGEE